MKRSAILWMALAVALAGCSKDTTSTSTSTQTAVNLASASTFAVMATSSITSTGATQINGDVGLNPGTSQGIPPAQINGTPHVKDAAVIQAQADLLAAYNDVVSRSTGAQTLAGNLGGLRFTPGLYVNSSSVLISGAGPNNNVTLDAQGNANAVFIFKMSSTLTTAPGAQVILAGGALAKNVYWQVGSSASLDTTTMFQGNILAAVSVTVNTNSVVTGRIFSGAGGGAASVTIDASNVSVP
jgi:ice-binding like protein